MLLDTWVRRVNITTFCFSVRNFFGIVAPERALYGLAGGAPQNRFPRLKP